MSDDATPQPPPTPQITAEQLAEAKAKIDAGEIRLTTQHHDVVQTGQACAMDLIIWLAEGRISDTAECVHPMISSHIWGLNDSDEATPETRWEIVEHAGPAVLGTATFTDAEAVLATFGAHTGAILARRIEIIRKGGGMRELTLDQVARTVTDAGAQGTSETPAATTGYGAPAATTGVRAPAATTGVRAPAATTGYGAPAATTGDGAPAATTGYGAPAATTGARSIAAAVGYGGFAKTGLDGAVIVAWKDSSNRPRVTVGYAGENGIEANTWYEASPTGDLLAVAEDDRRIAKNTALEQAMAAHTKAQKGSS